MIRKIYDRSLKGLFFVLLLALGLSPSLAQTRVDNGSSKSAVEQLVALLSDINSLRANVTQLLIDQDGRELQELEAHLVLQKPDHFYWAINSPYEELMVTNGKTFWLYEPDLDQVSIQDFDEDLNRAPILLLNASVDSLTASYEVSSFASDSGNRHQFVLFPINPGSLYERLSLTFYKGELEEMQVEDSLGQKTSLSFSDMAFNPNVDRDIFEFSVPSGVDVIDSRLSSFAEN